MTSFSSVKNWSAPYPSVSTAYLKPPSTVGNTAMTVPTSWSSAALSTFSPIANLDIENSFWNHRCDYISTNQLTFLNYVSESGFRNFGRRLLLKCLGLRVPGCSSPVETLVISGDNCGDLRVHTLRGADQEPLTADTIGRPRFNFTSLNRPVCCSRRCPLWSASRTQVRRRAMFEKCDGLLDAFPVDAALRSSAAAFAATARAKESIVRMHPRWCYFPRLGQPDRMDWR